MSEDKKPVVTLTTNESHARFLTGISEGEAAEIAKPMRTPARITGQRGRAWLCDLAAGCRKMGIKPEQDATLAHWVIEAPWAHPIWHSYSIVLVHLRPMPDGRPTTIYLDGATHEIWLWAIDPNADREQLVADGICKGVWLQPKNFASQFIEVEDELARVRVQDAVLKICAGDLSPDTDFQSDWKKLFGDCMFKNRPGGMRKFER